MIKISAYDPPMFDIPDHLKKCPIHSWRAETGIELIHKEPSLDELKRIALNYKAMDKGKRKTSDAKSRELFGLSNMQNYRKLKSEYISKVSSYSMNLFRAFRKNIKSLGIPLERSFSLRSGVLNNSLGIPAKISIQRKEINPISTFFHESGHIGERLFKGKASPLNMPARLYQELAANRTAANFILANGGKKSDIRTFYDHMAPRINTYVEGVKKHSPSSLIGAGPSSPADIRYLSKSINLPVEKLRSLLSFT